MNKFFDRSLNAMERRFGSWAVPGLIRYLAVAFVAVYLIGGVLPGLGPTIDFNVEKILAGEFWRPVTFILASSIGKLSMLGVVFSFFGMMLMFIFSDGLEQQWGVFRTNLFVLCGWASALIATIAVVIFTGHVPSMAGVYLGMSIFFAFSTYNPRYTIMLFMIIPTPIWILAAITGVIVSMDLLRGPVQAIFTLLCLSNYLVVAVSLKRSQGKSRARQRSFQSSQRSAASSSKQKSSAVAFNTCAVCGATEISHPENEFRVASDGKDYCVDHLPD